MLFGRHTRHQYGRRRALHRTQRASSTKHAASMNYVCAESAPRGRGADLRRGGSSWELRGDPAASFFAVRDAGGVQSLLASPAAKPATSYANFALNCLTAASCRVTMNRVRAKTARFSAVFYLDWVVDLMNIRSATSRIDSLAVRKGDMKAWVHITIIAARG
jgi:hypothetical protein